MRLVNALALGLVFSFVAQADTPADRFPRLDLAARPTPDGLFPVVRARVDAAFIKPDAALELYSEIVVAPVEVRFKTLRGEDGALLDIRQFMPDADQMNRLSNGFREALEQAISARTTYRVVQQGGLKALEMRAGLIDLHLDMSALPQATELADLLDEMTLVLELRDSVSSEVLVQAADTRGPAIPDPGSEPSSSRDNWRAVLRYWANLTAQRIGEIGGKTK